MSFDEGPTDGLTSDSDFRHKMAALLDEYQISFQSLCIRANVDYWKAHYAVEQGALGLPANLPILQQLLFPLGFDINYFLSPTPISVKSEPEKRRQLRTLVWDYIIRGDIPREHRRPLVEYVLSLLQSRPTSTMRLAARVGIPRTMTDVAFVYEDMKRRGLIQ
jgi:hypothetical protein